MLHYEYFEINSHNWDILTLTVLVSFSIGSLIWYSSQLLQLLIMAIHASHAIECIAA